MAASRMRYLHILKVYKMIEFSNGNLSQVFPKIEDFQREFSDKIGTNISKKREEL